MKWLLALISLSLLAVGAASAATTDEAAADEAAADVAAMKQTAMTETAQPPAGFVDRPLVALDWTLAETLTGLGVRAMGVGQVATYASWVDQPALPQGTRDLGLRTQPSLEQLAALAPADILISPMLSSLAPRLSTIAPVTSIAIYTPDTDTWQTLVKATRQLGKLTQREPQAEQLIRLSTARLAGYNAALRQQAARKSQSPLPLLMVQFMDDRHVRIFGDNSLFQAVIERMGIDNAWQGDTNAWGFATVSLEKLVTLKGRMVVVEPLPPGGHQALAHNGLWQAMPGVRENSQASAPLFLPPVWSFGALPSANRFAALLASHLIDDKAALEGESTDGNH